MATTHKTPSLSQLISRTTSTESRSSSPALPGAWPSNASPPAPLHLDRVVSFQHRLSLSLSLPSIGIDFGNSLGVAPSESALDSALSSEGSSLTRFTQDTSTSLSGLLYSSSSTTSACSPQGQQVSKEPGIMVRDQVRDSKYRIQPSRTPDEHIFSPSLSSSSIFGRNHEHLALDDRTERYLATQGISPRAQQLRIVLPHSVDTPSPASELSSTFPSPLSTSPRTPVSPISPIQFASPASSQIQFSLKPPAYCRDATYGGLGGDTSLSCESQCTPPTPSPAGLMAFKRDSRKTSSSSSEPLLAPPSEPSSPRSATDGEQQMLTSISLPNSWNLSPLSIAPLSLGPLSLDLNPATPAPSVHSNSEARGRAHDIIAFPREQRSSATSSSSVSPTPTPSPVYSPIASSACSPLLLAINWTAEPEPDAAEGENSFAPGESAADYAAAVMSSAWGSSTPSVLRSTIPESEAGDDTTPDEDAFSHALPVLTQTQGIEYISRGTNTSSGVLLKVKRIGGRLRQFLKTKGGSARGKSAFAVGAGVRNNVVVGGVTVESSQAVSAIPLDDNDPVPSPLPAPPGLSPLPRTRKPRPGLTSDTYLSGLVEGENSYPVISVSPPSDSGVPSEFTGVNGTSVEGKTACASSEKPRIPLISNSRRLSLPVPSNAASGSPSSSQHLEPPARSRARPRSVHILPQPLEQAEDSEVFVDGFMPDVPIIRISPELNAEASFPSPSPLSRSSSRSFKRYSQILKDFCTIEERVDKRGTEEARKQRRRFSLSAISNLTLGKRETLMSSTPRPGFESDRTNNDENGITGTGRQKDKGKGKGKAKATEEGFKGTRSLNSLHSTASVGGSASAFAA